METTNHKTLSFVFPLNQNTEEKEKNKKRKKRRVLNKYTIHDVARLCIQPACPTTVARKVLWDVLSFIWHPDRLHLYLIQWLGTVHGFGKDGVFLVFPLGGIISSLA